MKMPKIDLSKQGIQRFFLYHIEKVILLLAIAGFLAFIWLGFSTPKFADTDPEKLSRQADSASSHIRNPNTWDSVEPKRVAFDKADKTLERMADIKHDIYGFGIIRGIRMKTEGLRLDPDLDAVGTPVQLEYDVVRVPMLINNNSSGTLAIDDLDPAFDRRETSSTKRKEEPKYGNKQTDLQTLAIDGIQPELMGISSSRHRASVTNLVAIRGLVNVRQLWDEYKSKLESAVGYFPMRDRPTFQTLEFQRKRKDAPDEEWKDITGKLIRINRQYAKAAAEVVALEHYDSVLCPQIPPIAMTDYRRIANHSSLSPRDFSGTVMMKRQMQDSAEDEASDENIDQINDVFGGDDESKTEQQEPEQEEEAPVEFGSSRRSYDKLFELEIDGPLADQKVIRFFDPGVTSNTEYEYRVRIWLDDPNHENLGDTGVGGSRGNGRGTGGNDSGLGESGTRGSGGGGRSGAGAGAGAGAGDGFSGGGRGGGGPIGGRGGPPGRGGGGGSLEGGRGGPEGGRGGGGRSGGGRSGGGRGGAGGQQGNQPPRKYVKEPIEGSMTDISVRNRIDDQRASTENDAFKKLILNELQLNLDYSRPTGWATISVSVPNLEPAEVVVGNAYDFDNKGKPRLITYGNEPSTELLIGEMASKFGTLVSTYARAFRGDFLSIDLRNGKETNILHLVERSILKLTGFSFNSNKLVLDIIKSDAPWRFPSSAVPYSTPGEVLVMDLDGNFTVHNASEDRKRFLNWRFQPDQSNEYNLKNRRSTRRSPEEDGGRRGNDDDDEEGPFGGRGRG